MIRSPDSPSIIAISMTLGVFVAVGAGIAFSYVRTPAAPAIPDTVAKETAPAPKAVSPDAPTTVPRQEAGMADLAVRQMELWWRSREMERWWQSTHQQAARRNAPARLDTEKLAKPNARIAQDTLTPPSDPPRYLSDTSRWPLHGPANP